MISEKQLRKLGFVPNPNPEEHGFNDWVHTGGHGFYIGDFNGEGFLIDGMDWHHPITKYRDLKKLVKILKPYGEK